MMLRNYWHIACATSRIDRLPKAVRVLDQDLVLFRDAEGAPRALLDRCCHRGVRLSLGTVAGGRLACGYHGWEYDGAGRCVHIPSLAPEQGIPRGFEVRAFPLREQESYLFVWMGEGEPNPAAPPGIPDFDRFAWQQGVSEFACDAMRLIENNLDWCHPAFTHAGTHPQYFQVKANGFRDYEFETRVTEAGLALFFPPTAAAEDPVPTLPAIKLAFDLPGRVLIRAARPGMDYVVVMHFIPTGAASCRMEWLWSDRAGRGVAWLDEEPRLFTQDRIVESAQGWDGASEVERSVEADMPTLLARRIVALAERGAWEAERSHLPQRRLVHVRS